MLSEKINSFFAHYPLLTYQKGDVVIHEDDTQPHIYYLETGSVAQYDITSHGKRIQLTSYRPKSFFPLFTIFTGNDNRFFFVATEEVECRKAPARGVHDFLRENPDVLIDLTRRLYLGMDGLLSRMSSLLSGDACERILTHLKIITARYNKEGKDNFLFKTTHKDIAEQTGLSRETVSRTLAQLEKEGYIRKDQYGVVILSRTREVGA